MYKKILVVALSLVLLTSCGAPQEEYIAVMEERDAAIVERDAAIKERDDLIKAKSVEVDTPATESPLNSYQIILHEDYAIAIPSEWKCQKKGEDIFYYNPQEKSAAILMFSGKTTTDPQESFNTEDDLNKIVDSVQDGAEDFTEFSREKIIVNGELCVKSRSTRTIDNEENDIIMVVLGKNQTCTALYFIQIGGISDKFETQISNAIQTITRIDKETISPSPEPTPTKPAPTEPAPSSSSPDKSQALESSQAPPTEQPKKNESSSPPAASTTTGQRNALARAKKYLQYSAFSHQGLVEQLEHEQFSNSDALYGADNCGADWNEQAVKKAKKYLEYSSFSRNSLIDQLVFEGFTKVQAEYGAEQNGY